MVKAERIKVALIWNFSKARWIFDNWKDGHRAAIEYVGKRHDLDWYMGEECNDVPDNYQFLLFWTDGSDYIVTKFDQYNSRKGLILTSDNDLNPDILSKYNVIYCESVPVADKVRPLVPNVRVITSIGTDTKFFSPSNGVDKDIEYFYPATFSPWKKQSDIAHLGKDLLCVGTVQPDGESELKSCQDNGVKVKIGYLPATNIRNFYRRSRRVIIPAIHGSERTVLEAMSCDILPEVVHPEINVRANSYIREFYASGLNSPRKFILGRYSEVHYGEALLKGINES